MGWAARELNAEIEIDNSYAHMYGKGGAKVVINDVSKANAEKVVGEITSGESSLAKANVQLVDLPLLLLDPSPTVRTLSIKQSRPTELYTFSSTMPVSSATSRSVRCRKRSLTSCTTSTSKARSP